MSKKLVPLFVVSLLSQSASAEAYLSESEKNNAVNLKRDYSFNIPVMKYVSADGTPFYYDADFSYC